MNLEVISNDEETLGGTPVFKGTRVPIESLFDHLKKEFLLKHFSMIFLQWNVTKQLKFLKLQKNFSLQQT